MWWKHNGKPSDDFSERTWKQTQTIIRVTLITLKQCNIYIFFKLLKTYIKQSNAYNRNKENIKIYSGNAPFP